MVLFYFIRHGESTDNVKAVWAGSRDADLTQHGKLQAEALGTYLAKVSLDSIHSSDLKRASHTAREVKSKQRDASGVPHHESALLREQDFGSGEGRRFSQPQKGMTMAQHHAKGFFPAIHTRHHKFPDGECLDDVAERAGRAVDEILLDHVVEEAKADDGKRRVVAVVSHGIFIAELVKELKKRDRMCEEVAVKDMRGMRNTAWTRMEVTLANPHIDAPRPSDSPASDPPVPSNPVYLVTKIIDTNRYPHLEHIKRQGGGLGSLPYDPEQKDIRQFFGGGGKQAPSKPASKGHRTQPYAR